MHHQLLPLLSILLLMFHAFTLPLYRRKKSLYRNNLIVAGLIFCMSAASLTYVLKMGSYVFNVGHYAQPIGIAFRIGSIEALIGLLFSFVYGAIIWYSTGHLGHEINETKISTFYTLSSLLLASLLGITYTYDVFTAFVFMEVNTLASCGLIAIRDTKESIKATLKYMILSSLSSGLVLLGIAFLYVMTGHLSIPFIHENLLIQYSSHTNLVLISLILFTFGVAIKAALFPLHVWLPDAHTNAPATTSAILSSIVIKAPILFLIKLYYMVYGFAILKDSHILPIILTLGIVAMIFGSLLARTQKELKRMIAYSSVAQMGYIFMGIGLGNALGLTMAIYQMVAHSVTKSTLFLIVGSIIEKSGTYCIEDLKGIGKKMPFKLGIFSLCSLSMVGIPVLPGFINKWNLALASIEAGKLGLLIIILTSSLLNATYYFPIIINGFFWSPKHSQVMEDSKEENLKALFPLIALSIAIVAIGLFSGDVITIIQKDFFALQ